MIRPCAETAAGIAIAGLGWLATRRSSPAPAWLLPAWLLAWTTIVPLAVLELSLRPFHPGFEERVGDTRLFVPADHQPAYSIPITDDQL